MSKKDPSIFDDFKSSIQALKSDFYQKERENKILDLFIKGWKIIRNTYILMMGIIVIPLTHIIVFLFPVLKSRRIKDD